MKFIKIDDRISDHDDYLKEVKWMKKLFVIDLKEYFRNFGFKIVDKSNKNFKINFYNKDLDLLLEIKMNKKSKKEFV